MHLEIVSPEATLFSGEVESVIVPGTSGSFQMLNNHAPIVSTLKEGTVTISGKMDLKGDVQNKFKKQDGSKKCPSIDDWQIVAIPSFHLAGMPRTMVKNSSSVPARRFSDSA